MVGICRISLSIKNVWPQMNFRMKDNNSFSPGMDKATHPSGSGEIEVVSTGLVSWLARNFWEMFVVYAFNFNRCGWNLSVA